MNKKALWLRLKTYQFDHLVPPSLWQRVAEAFGGADAPTKAFADKLARKLGWPMPFALRAVAEYRKFVYLGMVSDLPVTPSKVIDQVWHEHQLFTQGYRSFCSEILGRHFDHHPELIPADDQLAAYHAQYHGTLALYEQEFNQDPPEDIWLVPKFQEEKIAGGAQRRRREPASSWIETSSYGDAPLYTFFESDAAGHGSGFDAFDGGQSGGGGGGADWSDSADGDAGSSDGGASSCGGSSCSSGCGSGGGGD